MRIAASTIIVDQVHVGGDIGSAVVRGVGLLLLLLWQFVHWTVLTLGTAPRIRRIESILSWNEIGGGKGRDELIFHAHPK